MSSELFRGKMTKMETYLVDERKTEIEMATITGSSRIDAIGVISARNLTNPHLVVKFVAGGTYLYRKVPTEKIDALLQAESVGKYFGAYIQNKYSFVKIFPSVK